MNSVQTHANLISEANILVQDIFSKSTDSIEKGLSRTGNRIIGALIGLSLIRWDLPASIFFFIFKEKCTDKIKLQKINAKLIHLEAAQLDITSLGYVKAEAARNFQKEVYENVGNYTRTALKIKNLITDGSILLSVGAAIKLLGPQFPIIQSSNLELATGYAINSGLLIAIPAAAYGLSHYLIEGYKLDVTQKDLAKKFLNQLSAS